MTTDVTPPAPQVWAGAPKGYTGGCEQAVDGACSTTVASQAVSAGTLTACEPEACLRRYRAVSSDYATVVAQAPAPR